MRDPPTQATATPAAARGPSRWRLLLAGLWLCAAAAAPLARAETGAAGPGVKRALLIGINQYRSVPSLQGSINDVETMRELLLSRFDFAPANIATLLDQAATRAGILAALQQLVREAGPNDSVYIHYSGHGSQVADLNGDEPDGLDETIVPQDGRTPGVPDIVDDELDALVARLRSRAVVIVLDSCHSGTATRSFDVRSRGIPADLRIELYRPLSTTARAIVPRMASRVVVLSGAADNEEALDGPIDGRFHGFFTYALARSIAAASPSASVRDVFGGVQRELARLRTQFGRATMPEPQLEGPTPAFDAPLFARGATAVAADGGRVASLAVAARAGRDVSLVNGALLGAAPGSTWAVYPPAETQFLPGHALAVATVARTEGKDAIATLAPGAVVVAAGARATLLMPAPLPEQIAIRVAQVPPARRREIETILSRALGQVTLVGPEQSARFTIDADGSTIRLLSADGLQLIGTFDSQSEEWGLAVARVVSRAVTASGLINVDNPGSALRVSARVAERPAPERRSIVLVADTQPVPYRIRRPGEPRSPSNSLQLAITVNADAYITVIDVDSDGGVNLLFPNPYQRSALDPDGRVPANQTLTVPDSLAPGNRAGFYWDYGPPAGLDTIRVFASSDLATANLIRQRIHPNPANPAATRGLDAARSPARAVRALREDLLHAATRGISVVADGPDPLPAAAEVAAGSVTAAGDWSAATLTIVVHD